MKNTILDIVKNLTISVILTTVCIILSAVIMTYLRMGFDLALYLVQCAIIIPCMIVSYKLRDAKKVIINAFIYIIIVLSAIFVSVSEFAINKNILYFILIVILSSMFGHLFRKYIVDKN